MVKKQRQDVNTLLEKDKDFRIKGYFNDLLEYLNISGNKIKSEISEEDLDNEYTEIKLEAHLINLNTRDLCNLLNEIEKSERVYTKELEIFHFPKKPTTIEVNLTIATLQPKLITSE